MTKKLSEKQELFCRKFLETLNASEAYRCAYPKSKKWNPDSVNQAASKLLSSTKVLSRVDALKAKRNERLDITADDVLRNLVEIKEMNIKDILTDKGDLKPISEWPDVWCETISGLDIATINSGDTETILKKIKWPDKLRNLELIGKHVNVQAWKDKVEHDVNGKITLEELIASASEEQ